MLDNLRRIFLTLIIVVVAGLLLGWIRSGLEGYGLFDLLRGKPLPGKKEDEPLVPLSEVPYLNKISEESAKLAAAVLPAVVSIDTTTEQRDKNPALMGVAQGRLIFGYPYRVVPGLGSGIIVEDEGYIVTNSHVVAKADLIIVTTNDQRKYEAEVVGADLQADIAVLKITDSARKFPILKFADSDEAKVGQWVLAAGNPFGLQGSVTQGIISATRRSFSDMSTGLIQTDTVINPGNSGGPLVNVQGEMVGVNVSIFTEEGGGKSWQGIGLAIPANDVKTAYENIRRQGPPSVGYLGITIRETVVRVPTGLGTSTIGVVVDFVEQNSPAEKAGLRSGDVIAAINDNHLETPNQVFLLVKDTPPGGKLKFTVVREGQVTNLTAILQVRPQA